MTLKNCLNKHNPFLNLLGFTFKKNLGFTIIATIITLIFSPGFIWSFTKDFADFSTTYELTQDMSVVSGVMAVACTAFCILLLIINFGYLYSKKGTDAYHALPLTRIELFCARFIPAYVSSLVPLIAAYLGVIALGKLPYIDLDVAYIIPALIFTAFMILMLSLFTMVFIISAGAVFDAVVSIAAINIGIPVIIIFILEVCNNSLFGYANSIGNEPFIYGTPFGFAMYKLITYCENYGYNEVKLFPIVQTIILVILTVLLAALCLWLYNKRKSEKAEEAYAFSYMPMLISVIIGFIGCYCLGFIFSQGTVSSIAFWIMGAVGTALAIIIYSLISNRGFKKLKQALWLSLITFVLFVAVNVGISLDIFGYGSYIPKVNEVKNVNVNVVQYASTEEKAGIEKVMALHSEIIKNKDKANDYDHYENYDYIKIIYTLKNGEIVERGYSMPSVVGKDKKKDIIEYVTVPFIKKTFEEFKDTSFVLEGYYGENKENYGSVRLSKEKTSKLIAAYCDYLKKTDEKIFSGWEYNAYLYTGYGENQYWQEIAYNSDAVELIKLLEKTVNEAEKIEESVKVVG
ncbi:MAG: hypothetical protein IJP22_02495 [Clostridia bacterium]|nr:hypothetical protein [Clostridia bacterium]